MNAGKAPIAPPYTKEMCDALPKFDRSVSLVCWAYNEEEQVAEFLQRAHTMMSRYVADFEIVIVDDGSTDKTQEIIRRQMAVMPEIRLVVHERNMNVARATASAIKAASKDYLFWQTVDWCYDITQLRAYLELLRTYDIVAGVRRRPVEIKNPLLKPVRLLLRLFNIKHLTKRSDTVTKAIISVCNYLLLRLLFRLPLSDYQNVVFYPTSLVQPIAIESSGSLVNPELLLKAYWKKASIVEVPIAFLPRKSGVAKGTRVSSVLRSFRDVWKFWFRWLVLGRREYTGQGATRRLIPAEWGDECLGGPKKKLKKERVNEKDIITPPCL